MGSEGDFLQSFTFSSKYKACKANVITDALSRMHHMLALLKTKILGFEMIKDMYETNPDLQHIHAACKVTPFRAKPEFYNRKANNNTTLINILSKVKVLT